jgi:probable addiction module antidote protein
MASKRKARPRETLSRYDAADYLKSDKDVIAYLEAAMEDGDAAAIASALGNIARARGMMHHARETGLTREGLYRALSADGNPSLGTVLKVMKALGLRLAPQRVEVSERALKARDPKRDFGAELLSRCAR